MIRVFIQKYKSMILVSLLFFYLGCGITLSFIHIDCATASSVNHESSSDRNQIEYVVLVISSPENAVRRDAIRATWANFVNNIVLENGEKLYRWNHTWVGPKVEEQKIIKVLYVVGTKNLDPIKLSKLESENSRTNDMLLLENLHDSYSNLASKLLHSLKWLSENFKQMKYVVKCDDDSFVRIDLVVKDLDAFAPTMSSPELEQYVTFKDNQAQYRGLYWGYFDGRAKVFLNGKWEEKDWFLCDTYLPYALGGGYVISRNIVDYIAKNGDLLSLYYSEDVSMGVWTAALNDINRVHDVRFDTQWKSRGCDAKMLVRHKQTPGEMFDMYKTLVHSHGKKLCKTETSIMRSYYYNWNVLPSSCCKG